MRNEPCQTANVALWREFCEVTGRDPSLWSPHWTELDVRMRLCGPPLKVAEPAPKAPKAARYDYEHDSRHEVVSNYDAGRDLMIETQTHHEGFALIDKTRGHDKPLGYTFDRDDAERIVAALNRSET